MPVDLQTNRDSTESEKPAHEFVGRHLLASYCGCDRSALLDVRRINAALAAAVGASGATLLKSLEDVFPPHGFTAVALLAESHASIHTYPEHGACFVDIFTCGLHCDVEAFDAELRRHLRPQKVSVQIVERVD